MPLILNLLDRLELRADAGEPVRLPIGKEGELLALLTYRRAGVPRTEAAGLLWPDSPADAALHRLRTVIHELRRRNPGLLDADRDRIGLSADVASDLSGEGEFAPGLRSDWLEEARVQLALLRAETLSQEARLLAQSDPPGALSLARKAVRAAPEALAPRALVERLEADLEVRLVAQPLLSPRERARLAVGQAPLRLAEGRAANPAAELDALLSLEDGRADPLEPALRAALMVARAGYAYERAQFTDARRLAGEALSLQPAPADRGWAYVWISRAALMASDFDGAISAARRAIRLDAPWADPLVPVVAQLVVSAVALRRNRILEAEQAVVRAREAGEGLGGVAAVMCENAAGWLSLSEGAPRLARERFDRALALGASCDVRLLTSALRGLARVASTQNDRTTARARLEEASRALEGSDFDLMAALVLAQVAELDEAEGRYAEALAGHRACLARRTDDRLGLFTSLAGIGRVELRLGRAVKAVRRLREAFALHTAIFGDVRLAVAALPLAEALLASGRTREAASLVRRALDSLADEPATVLAGDTYPAEIRVLAERLTPLALG